MDNKILQIRNSVINGLRPPPDITISEWADKYRVLPRLSSSEHGRWRTSRFPFLKEIMDELSPQSTAREIVVMKGAQLGFTEVAVNKQLYNIHYYPCPSLYIQKTVDNVKRYSKQRLTPSIELIPEVLGKLSPVKTRDASNTIFIKIFPGGILILGGANSAASLRSMPIKDLDLDEWDSFELGIQEEGDPAELAIRRTPNFPRRKIYYLSTPITKETSRIEPKFLEGDQRFYYIKCVHGCGHFAPIGWHDPGEKKCFTIKYTDDNPKSAVLLCPNCDKTIKEIYKTDFLSKEGKAKWVSGNEHGNFPSFHLSSLYSPLGFYSWEQAVELWLKAERNFDKELLKVFINTVLAETFSETGKRVESAHILTRREKYPAQVPAGVNLLIAGADVQDQRIECEIVGFGRNEESWSIEYRILQGDTEQDLVWTLFDQYLMQTWKHESGADLHSIISMIDCGYRTRKVYTFCKLREHRRIFPIKGVGGWGKGLISRPPQNRRNESGVLVFTAYVDEIKAKFYSQLKVTLDEEEKRKAGYCHFPKNLEYDHNYFRMLTAERLVASKNLKKLEWKLAKGKRNEALDCRCYAIAGLNIINPNFDMIDKQGGVLNANNIVKKKTKRRVLSRGHLV